MASLNTDGLEIDQVWDTERAFQHFHASGRADTKRTAERHLHALGILPAALAPEKLEDELGRPTNQWVLQQALSKARSKRKRVLFVQLYGKQGTLHANDARGARYWVQCGAPADTTSVVAALTRLQEHVGKEIAVFPHGELVRLLRDTTAWPGVSLCPNAYAPILDVRTSSPAAQSQLSPHLRQLEAQSIHLIREAVAQADKPVMLYSAGKECGVMWHLARKAFYPAPPPFTLLHIDTRWQFQEMNGFRDHMAQTSGMDLLVHVNPDAVAKDINPFDHGSALHTNICKTKGLEQALTRHKFDIVMDGTRHEEENARAYGTWPAMRWSCDNIPTNPGQSLRVMPLSDWTELDIWHYIYQSAIPVVSLYFAKKRPVVLRDGALILIDDNRFRLLPGEEILEKQVRFRTLSCYPLSSAFVSDASTLPEMILELVQARSGAKARPVS